MKRGDVCLARVPFTDGTGMKLRPVLVVSGDNHNRGDDIVVLAVTTGSHLHDRFTFPIGASLFAQAGLRVPSVVKWSKPMTIAKSMITRHLGAMPDDVLEDICEKLQSTFRR